MGAYKFSLIYTYRLQIQIFYMLYEHALIFHQPQLFFFTFFTMDTGCCVCISTLAVL
jgi:hypothetical protein